MSDFQLVSFDFWNTLMHERGPGALVAARLPEMQRLLADAGFEIGLEALAAAHDAAQREFEASAHAGDIYETPHAARRIATELALPHSVVDLIDRSFTTGSAAADVEIVAGVTDLVRRIADRGIALAIVCDVGLTPSPVLLDWLGDHGIGDLFDVTAFSDRTGQYKPDRGMFDEIMEATGVLDAGRVVHIGDRLRTDVEGARRLGIRSVRFRGVFDDPASIAEADHVVDDMREFGELVLGVS